MDLKDLRIEELELAIGDRNYELSRLQSRIDRALELLDDYNIADWYPCTETDTALRLERAIRAALGDDDGE